jgi:glutamine synthetase
MEAYCKTINIEALTMVDLVKGMMIPACVSYQNEIAKLLERKKSCGSFDTSLETGLLDKISKLSGSMLKKLDTLEVELSQAKNKPDINELASFTRGSILSAMSELRTIVDELETMVSRKYWPFPVYGELLFSII